MYLLARSMQYFFLAAQIAHPIWIALAATGQQ